ncbi:sigma 54-interacting transcriptional regulator [Hymenobacter sp. GOD-10R]|uniref:sigma-54-dependent Fis family transcriptional regulator n=1 Tax=Hymenobacter sp. GOD-10R TaxID=3093922 RepID=UPI002D79A0F9|nr:sigma 54-interacting transcriptional regulator [Hymenobacter sp. GOD-10R]WRQ28211.1 sigma 54-interacting transcriptional regulator [Hymenobacter sp. GOD-10R]
MAIQPVASPALSNQDESLLLYLNEAIATTRDKDSLFKIVTEKLRLIFPFDTIVIVTLDPEGRYKRLFLRDYLTSANLPHKGVTTPSLVAGTATEYFLRNPEVHTIKIQEVLDQYPDSPFCLMVEQGIHYITIAPMRTGGTQVGLLCLASRKHPSFGDADVRLLEKISSLVAVAVSNTIAFEEIARREREKTIQLAVNNALLTIKEREQLFQRVATEINRVVPYDYFGVRIRRQGGNREALVELRKEADGTFEPLDPNRWNDVPNYNEMEAEAFELFVQPALYSDEKFAALAKDYRLFDKIRQQYGTCSIMTAPLWVQDDRAAALILSSRQNSSFTEEDLELIMGLVPQITLALQNLFAFEQIESLRAQLERERTYLMDEINTTANFGEFIGNSPALQPALTRIQQVAPTDTTVLVTGETGTGKELAARALHNLSPRRDRALIKLNCAALPAQLIESELFGHEKGAFTGAVDRRIGKFELADGGTIFLDEIGELPLDLQAKLLRVLQEKEFERIGGRRVIKTDTRIIAATNRILEDEVAAGHFRADLYYRLNVFPIKLPALRERPEDIEPLIRFFLERLTKKMAKPVRGLRERDLRAMQQYSWPGNIRELEHVLEQAVIVSTGPFLEFAGFSAAAAQASPPIPLPDHGAIKTLRDQERDHILAALKRTGGRVSGPNGAAVLLDINAKTLEARMKKLGIRRTVGVE